MSLCNVFAGENTVISHALILQNLGGIEMVALYLIRRIYVHKLEIIGSSVAIFGCFITVLDKEAKKIDPSSQNIVLGDLFALSSSFFTASYYYANSKIVSKMPPLLAVLIIIMFSQM
jgi:drug/metabolite transporter (DMT)-like permease